MGPEQLGQLYVALVTTATGLIIAIGGLGIAYLKKLGRKINDEKLRVSYETTLGVIDDTVRSVLLDTSENLEKRVADGVLTKEEIKAIQDEVVKQATIKIAPAMLKQAEQHVGDFGAAMEARIKSKIQEVNTVTN